MSDSPIDSLRSQFEADLAAAASEADLRAVRDRYLSRKGGLVSGLLKSLGSASAEDRPRLGQLANTLKQDIETQLDARLAACGAVAPAERRGRRHAPRPRADGRATGTRSRSSATASRRSSRAWDFSSSRDLSSRTITTTSKRSTCRRSTPRATCRTRSTCPRRCVRRPAHRRRCCARTPPACRSVTWRRTSRRCVSSLRAGSTAATIST